MAWSVADRDALRAAVLELATGKRKVTVTFGDGHVATFALVELDKLRALLAEAESDVNAASTTPRPKQYLGSASKGL